MDRHRPLTSAAALALLVASAATPMAASASDISTGCAPGASGLTGAIGAGAFCTDALGPDVAIETSHEWIIPVHEPGAVILADPEAAPPVKALLLLRATLADRSNDPAAWFADDERIEVVSSGTTSVGDTEAHVFDVTADVPGDIHFLAVPPPLERIVMRSGEYYRIWWIDRDDGDPIVGFAPVAVGDESWLARADEIMGSLTLGVGPDGSVPGPSDLAIGPVAVDGFSLGRLGFDLPVEADVLELHPGFVLVQLPGLEAGVAFIAPRATGDGDPLRDVAELRAAFEAATALSEGATSRILGQEVVALAADDRSALPGLVPDPDDSPPFIVTAPEGFGRDYLLDTDAGPLLIGVFAEASADVDAAIELFEALAGSITLS